MSQRLHIGPTDKNYYDCVITSAGDKVKEKLLAEWLNQQERFYVGPWKIYIGDIELWEKLRPTLEHLFEELGERFPDCIWMFRYSGEVLWHPTRSELDAFLDTRKKMEADGG